MKKLFLLIMLLIVTNLLAVACAPQTVEVEVEKEVTRVVEVKKEVEKEVVRIVEAVNQNVTLTFWHRWTEKPSERMTELMAEFEKLHPNITIEQNSLGDQEYKDTIRTVMASPNAPDLFFSYGGTWLKFLVDAGLVANLDDYYEQYDWQSRFVTSAIDSSMYDGKHYALPFEIGTTHMLYNKGVFDKIGLTISPEPTWSEFLEVAAKLKENDIAPIAFGNVNKWPSQWWFDYPLNRMQGREFYIDLVEGRAKYNDEKVIETLNTIKRDLVDRGYFMPDFNALDWFDADAVFASGQAGMYLNLAGGVPYIYPKAPDGQELEIGWFIFPRMNEAVPIYNDNYVESYFAISEASEHKTEAAMFLDFVTAPENANRWNEIAMTAVIGADEGLSPLFKEFQAAMAKYPGYTHYVLVTHPELSSAFLTAWQEILAGTLSVENGMERVEKMAADLPFRGEHPAVGQE